MPISDAKARNAQPHAKPYKIADSGGLYLLINPSGSKLWRFKYRLHGKEKLLSLGAYPEVSLLEAREGHLQARKLIAHKTDPAETKRAAKRENESNATNTFEAVAREWHGKRKVKWKSNTGTIHIRRLETHVFPRVKGRAISSLKAGDMLEILRSIESEGKIDTARRVLQACSKVFNYGIATQKNENNPMPALSEALQPVVHKNLAFIKPDGLYDFYQKVNDAPLHPLTKLGLELIIMTMLRTGEHRFGQWDEIDWENAIWNIPADRMKMKTPHIVPLSRQAVQKLKEIQKISGENKWIFPNEANQAKVMSENTMLFAMYGLGYRSRATVHGFRSTASTVLNESGLFNSDWIERQLSHEQRSSVRAAYNHAQYLPQRRKMMQWWADYLDEAAKKKPKKRR
jgi:integrase